jgi:polyisoprenoid-binding protein YceI
LGPGSCQRRLHPPQRNRCGQPLREGDRHARRGRRSIDTKNKKRDERLRSAEFFDAANHPAISFTAKAVQPSGDGVTVTGQLTVRGQTRPLAFDAVIAVPAASEVSLDAEVRINRADFGITWNQMGMASWGLRPI